MSLGSTREHTAITCAERYEIAMAKIVSDIPHARIHEQISCVNGRNSSKACNLWQSITSISFWYTLRCTALLPCLVLHLIMHQIRRYSITWPRHCHELHYRSSPGKPFSKTLQYGTYPDMSCQVIYPNTVPNPKHGISGVITSAFRSHWLTIDNGGVFCLIFSRFESFLDFLLFVCFHFSFDFRFPCFLAFLLLCHFSFFLLCWFPASFLVVLTAYCVPSSAFFPFSASSVSCFSASVLCCFSVLLSFSLFFLSAPLFFPSLDVSVFLLFLWRVPALSLTSILGFGVFAASMWSCWYDDH